MLPQLIQEARALLEGRPQSAAVAVEQDGKILLLKRGKTAPWMPGKWNLPGGAVDAGESPEQAARREAAEEANIRVGKMRLVQKVNLGNEVGDVYFFHSTDFTGKPRINWESEAMQWAPKAAAPGYPLVPGVKGVLMKVAKLESVTGRAAGNVAVFDFDGTLFKSPDKPDWWRGKPWWHDPESLEPPCVPAKPDSSWWNDKIVSAAKKRIADPKFHTILLTGRKAGVFDKRVRDLLKQAGLHFDEVLLSTSSSTLDFKSKVLRAVPERLNANFIELWDDHPRYTRNFQSMFDKRGIRFSIKNASTLMHEPACPTPE